MTPRRENLLKKIKEIGKNIPVIETYRNGRLVLSNIENANEEMVQIVKILQNAYPVELNRFEKFLLNKNIPMSSIDMVGLVAELLVEISEDKIKVDVETKQGKHIMI